MAKTVICTFVMGNSWEQGKPEVRLAAVLDIYPNAGGEPRRLAVGKTQTLKLNYGDRIKCISGTLVVLVNPGTQAGAFRLFPNSPACVNWNDRTDLEMNDDTTKHRHRGKISVTGDIGNISRITGSSSESVNVMANMTTRKISSD